MLTSPQRRLVEADMSRRDFLKTTGQAAAGAAIPKIGFISSKLPSTPDEVRQALVGWLKQSGIYGMFAKSKYAQSRVYEVLQLANPKWYGTRGYEPKSIDNLAWIMHLGNDGFAHVASRWRTDAGVPEDTFIRMPDWLIRYHISNWAGKEVSIDHPFIKDRTKWHKFINDVQYSAIVNKELYGKFKDILQNTITDDRLKELVNDKFVERIDDILTSNQEQDSDQEQEDSGKQDSDQEQEDSGKQDSDQEQEDRKSKNNLQGWEGDIPLYSRGSTSEFESRIHKAFITSPQRRLVEADMSRRDFLKTTGQASVAMASPTSALKALFAPNKLPNNKMLKLSTPEQVIRYLSGNTSMVGSPICFNPTHTYFNEAMRQVRSYLQHGPVFASIRNGKVAWVGIGESTGLYSLIGQNDVPLYRIGRATMRNLESVPELKQTLNHYTRQLSADAKERIDKKKEIDKTSKLFHSEYPTDVWSSKTVEFENRIHKAFI